MIKAVPFIITDANALRPEDITDLKELEEIVLEKAAGREVRREGPPQPYDQSPLTSCGLHEPCGDGDRLAGRCNAGQGQSGAS